MSGRILIVDGLARNRLLLKGRLAPACYDIATAATFAELAARLAGFMPDLVIVSGGLPDHDGVDICRWLRANGSAAIIALCPPERRLAALRAGASAVLDSGGDELLLLARIRGLLRDSQPADLPQGFAESQALFQARDPAPRTDRTPRVVLVADGPARAMAWKLALSRRLPYEFATRDPALALAAVAEGEAADLYLIAADLDQPGEGLRLLSELRSRPASRDAAFIVAAPPDRQEMAAIALDLGAGETLCLDLAAPGTIEMSLIAIAGQIARKRQADDRRAEALQSMLWSMIDPLTGLYNRRYAIPELARTLAEVQRHGGECAVLSLDVDRFKRINDQHGHAAGDAVLAAIAARIQSVADPHGPVARMGGEEFLVLLPGLGLSAASDLAEDIRRAVMSAMIPLPRGGALSVTVSIGVAAHVPGPHPAPPAQEAAALLDRADHAMRAAKAMGRNRCILAPTGLAA